MQKDPYELCRESEIVHIIRLARANCARCMLDCAALRTLREPIAYMIHFGWFNIRFNITFNIRFTFRFNI